MKSSRLNLSLSLAVVFTAGIVVARAGEGDKPSAQPSVTPGSSGKKETPPVAKAPEKKSEGLKRLEEDLFKPFRGFSSDDPAEGVRSPNFQVPPPNAAQAKHAQELLDRRKNWAFMTPEELIGSKSKEEEADQQNKSEQEKAESSLTPMERYYQSLFSQKAPTRNLPGKNKSDNDKKNNPLAGVTPDPDNSDSGSGFDDSSKEARKSSDGTNGKDGKKNSVVPQTKSSFFADVFALERPRPTTEEDERDKMRLESYKRSLGLPPTPVFTSKPVSPFGDPEDLARGLFKPPVTVDSTPTTSTTPKPGVVGLPAAVNFTPAIPGAAPVANNSSLSSFTPALPKVDTTRSSLPPQPTFMAPRRQF